MELNLVGLAPDGKQKIVPGILHGLVQFYLEIFFTKPIITLRNANY